MDPLYNQSSQPNPKVVKNFEEKEIRFEALENISIESEITFKYGTIWFEEKWTSFFIIVIIFGMYRDGN